MYTLCMDTSHILLGLSILKDDTVLISKQSYCWKRQSEEIFQQLEGLLDTVNLTPSDIQQIVITEGPGSYTGVRIAMTIAKVFCATADIPLYTIGTLDLYGAIFDNCSVLLDARSNRAYYANYREGKRISDVEIIDLDLFDKMQLCKEVIGDGELVKQEKKYPDLGRCFLASKANWKLAENVHLVTPEYLKSAESYLVKK